MEREAPLQTEVTELIRQARSGQAQAFTALVDRYRDPLCGMAYAYLGSAEDAQDVAQEVLIYAYLHLGELREADRFAAWLRQITRSRCCDRLRREPAPLSLDQLAEQSGDAAREGAGKIPSASLEEERLATRLVVREALSRLSEKTRLAVSLHYLAGYSHAEIARFLDIPLNTVRSRLQIAKRQLREEMLAMVTDVLSEGRPDPEFTRRVVEEAMRRAKEAEQAHATGDALAHYDEALAALEKMEPGEVRERLKMEALWRKGGTARFLQGMDQAVRLYDRSAATAEKLGDRRSQAEQLLRSAGHNRDGGQAERDYHQALRLYRELGDARGEGECLFWLGIRSLHSGEAAAVRDYAEQAQPLLEAGGERRLAAVCRAIHRLLAEVGEEVFPHLRSQNVSCDVLEQAAEAVRIGRHSDFRGSKAELLPPALAVLRSRTLFAHLAPSDRLLDPAVPVGGGWSGPSWSYSAHPLRTVVTVHSASERVTVPAGTFENCLLIEQVTTEGDRAPGAGDRQADLASLCGTRAAWYAPGVGLVQLRLRNMDGAEACAQLAEYALQEPGSAYLPLAVGNRWTYTWPSLPERCAGRERYEITARNGSDWYLESYGYLAPEG
jgi:RNA polymerase sigma-70 factor (ECF subfamily)